MLKSNRALLCLALLGAGCNPSPDSPTDAAPVDLPGAIPDLSTAAPVDSATDSATEPPPDAALPSPDLQLPLPLVAPTTSLLVGPDLDHLRTGWKTPAHPLQGLWKTQISSRADAVASTNEPLAFADAANWSSIAQARALRWLMDPNAVTAKTDRDSVVAILESAALPGGTTITRPEVAMNYLAAFDLINAGLTANERAAIALRMSGGAFWQGLGIPLQVNNQFAKWASTRGFAALLFAMDKELIDRLADLDSSLSYDATDDGWYTDAPTHYLNYTLAQLAPFALALKNSGERDLYPRLSNFVTMSLGLRMPNGLGPCVQNGANTGIAFHLLSRGLADPALQAAALWNLADLGTFDWTSWTNVENNDASYTDFFWAADFGVVPAAPTWSPAYFSRGQGGVATFRNDWSRTSHYLNLSAGIDGKGIAGFGQMNTAAIVVGAAGTEVLVEPGYNRQDLANTPMGFNSVPATEHNILLSRDTGTTAWGIGDDGAYQTNTDSPMLMSDTLDAGESGGHHGVCDFARLAWVYGGGGVGSGASGRRSIAFPNEEYFVVADLAHSDAGPNKDFAVNLVGKGPLSTLSSDPSQLVVAWKVTQYGTYNGGQTLAGEPYTRPVDGMVTAHLLSNSPLALATDTTWMHENYDRYQQTYRARATATDQATGIFLSILEVGAASQPARLSVKTSSIPLVVLAAVTPAGGGWTDTWIAPALNTVVAVGQNKAGAELAWLRESGGALVAAMLVRGNLLVYQGQPFLSTSAAITFSIANNPQPKTIAGTVTGDARPANTQLRVQGRGKIVQATFEGKPMNIDNSNAMMPAVTLPRGAGGFVITTEQ